jgi:hypothetical protein
MKCMTKKQQDTLGQIIKQTETAKELNVTPVLEKKLNVTPVLEKKIQYYRRNWIRQVNRRPHTKLDMTGKQNASYQIGYDR